MIIIDNFIKDPRLLAEIQSDSNWQGALPYSWFDSCGSPPSNVWERVTAMIWSTVGKDFGEVPDSFDGVEYWSNIMSVGGRQQDLPWHFDKDEAHCAVTGELISPYVGSVYYAHTGLPDEGYLEMRRGDGEGDVERIQPVSNRLVIFDSAKVHRVTPVTGGMRRCFATNIWITKPSEENFR